MRSEPEEEMSELSYQSEGEDTVDLLDEAEALELVEFDPSIEPSGSWEAPKTVKMFLEKHFNRTLSEDEREAIRKDFPKPSGGLLVAPKLDDQVKEHLKSKGKDPHFGAEKSLFRIQEQVMEVAGPLTCLWSDLLNSGAKVSAEDTVLLIQRALVMLGSMSHSITQERRRIAWTRINPKLKGLAEEDYDKRESNLFGPGFLEKAAKKMEVDKTMDKVATSSRKPGSYSKRPRFEHDKSDLRSFLYKGAPGKYGNRRFQRQQPYSRGSFNRFQSRKYNFQRPPARQTQELPKVDLAKKGQ